MAPFLSIHGGGSLVGGVPFCRARGRWSNEKAIAGPPPSRVPIKRQAIDAEVECVDRHSQNICCGIWLEQEDRGAPSISLHIHIRPKGESCGDIDPCREVEDTF